MTVFATQSLTQIARLDAPNVDNYIVENTASINKLNSCLSTHQLVEDVSLVDMDGDERLVLGPLISAQLSGCHVNQLVEQIQELLIGRLHDLSANQMRNSEGRGSAW